MTLYLSIVISGILMSRREALGSLIGVLLFSETGTCGIGEDSSEMLRETAAGVVKDR
jgi:hypothetical protein